MYEKLYTYGRYAVIIVDDLIDEDTDSVVKAYGVINIDTGVIELRHRMLFHAIKWAQVCESETSKMEVSTIDDLAEINLPPKQAN